MLRISTYAAMDAAMCVGAGNRCTCTRVKKYGSRGDALSRPPPHCDVPAAGPFTTAVEVPCAFSRRANLGLSSWPYGSNTSVVTDGYFKSLYIALSIGGSMDVQ